MATKNGFKPTTTDLDPTILETPIADPETLEQLLAKRYDVEGLAEVFANNFVNRLDEAFINKVKQLLINRPAPINVPVVSGNFLAGVTYENS